MQKLPQQKINLKMENRAQRFLNNNKTNLEENNLQFLVNECKIKSESI